MPPDIDRQREEFAQRLNDFLQRASSIRDEVAILDDTLAPSHGTLRELIDSRSSVEMAINAHEQIAKLRSLKDDLAGGELAGYAPNVPSVLRTTLRDFSELISARLAAWGVPDASNVHYDDQEHDIVAGEQLRSAHGKGVRAILHASFTVALAQYCFQRGLPHPGFVILDSPLVTYRPPEDGGPVDSRDVLDPSVAARFYADIQQNFDGQIIVMENMDPPNGLDEQSVDIPFTKNSGYGRYGFFPTVS